MKKRKDYSQVSVQERKKMIEQIYVIYPRIQATMDKFSYCHQQAKVAGEPEGMLLEGPAGMGKTTLCKYYMSDFPIRLAEERTIMPILMAKVEVPASPKSLVTALLTALGDPFSDRGTTVSQTLRLKRLMYECGVELIFLDEFQHFIDRDSKKVLQTVSDWLKNLMDSTGTPIILVGMPYSHNILDSGGNEQLQRRFSMRVSHKPFDWNDVEDREDFRRFLEAVDKKLPLNEWSNISDTNIAFLLYLASDGIVSKVMRLIRRAASIALDLSRERLDLDLFNIAYEECLAAVEPDKENPFDEGVKGSIARQSGKYEAKRATNTRSKTKEKQLRASDVL
jgi:predicted AAA+ superfamily ATPase